MMHGREKSDSAIVAGKPTNRDGNLREWGSSVNVANTRA
jgi:hypothetical protein